jgi:hypothetical protein
MTNLFFIRSCPIWNIQIPAQSVQEIPEWIAKRLITGGVAMLEADHRARMAERSKRKADEKAKVEESAKILPEKVKKEPDTGTTVNGIGSEKKSKKGGKE